MPVISKSDVVIGGQRFKRVIKVDAKGTFSAELPPWVSSALLCNKVITAKSHEDLNIEWDKVHKAYTAAKSTTAKVICVRLKCNARIMDAEDEKAIFCVQTSSFASGLTLDFSAGVYQKTTVYRDGGKDKTSYAYQASSIPRSACNDQHDLHDSYGIRGVEIEWTAERETFVAQLCHCMENLIMQMHALCDNKKMIEMIESGKLLEFKA